jgi:hypothetical protein
MLVNSNFRKLSIIGFVTATVIIIAGAMFKILHLSGANIILATGMLLEVIFFITLIYSLTSKPKNS